MFYSLIMALIMLALGIVSFWGRNQDSFEGLLPAGWQAYRLQPAACFLANYVRKNALRVGLGIVSVVMGLTLLLFSIFAPLTSAFKRSLGYYSVASILFAVLQMQEEMQLTVLFWPLPCLAPVYLPGHGALAIFTDYDHQRAAGPSFK